MTRFRSSFLLALLVLTGCASSSGAPISAIPDPAIAAAYIRLASSSALGLVHDEGAAMVIAPGVAVTNAHNANLLDPALVIGTRQDFDLLFFRTSRRQVPQTGTPQPGMAVTAYGQGAQGGLRVATGVVRTLAPCKGCRTSAPAYFTFAGNAGPGFSGGPVLDGRGRLVGITFGYRDQGHGRLIYAYGMDRVRAEFQALQKAGPATRKLH